MSDQATDSEIEQERLEALRDRPEGFEKHFAPGTHGCHEALHTAALLADIVGDRLVDHAAVALRPDWHRMAWEARERLFELYQAIGREHL